MIETLKTILPIVICLIVLLAIFIIAVRTGHIKQVKQTLLCLVIRAEKLYGGKTGQLKFSAVCNWIYELLPLFARTFISAELIGRLINNAVEEMKKYLESNNATTEYINTEPVLQAVVKNIYAPTNMTQTELYDAAQRDLKLVPIDES